MAVGLLATLFSASREAAVLLVVRHPYFWHHVRHCNTHAPPCLLRRWSEVMRDALRRLISPGSPLRALPVRFEDLVLAKQAVMGSVFETLGLPPLLVGRSNHTHAHEPHDHARHDAPAVALAKAARSGSTALSSRPSRYLPTLCVACARSTSVQEMVQNPSLSSWREAARSG